MTNPTNEPSRRVEQPLADVPSSDQLGRYHLVRTLGVGAFASVFLAFDRHLEREVAVKVPFLQDPEHAAAFRNEAISAASLEHANILPVYDFGETVDGRVFCVMKYINGPTLAEVIESRAQSYEAHLVWMVSVATAAHHAHTRGLVHRDIKPSNVMIDKAGKAWLVDFGLSAAMNEASIRAGTPAYMAPELWLAEAAAPSAASDIWAIGVVLYELIAGRKPFGSSSIPELMSDITSKVPHPISGPGADIATRCLCKSPSDRFVSAAELATELAGLLPQSSSHSAGPTI